LVATDFSETAERGLEAALELAAPEADIEVLHCWRSHSHYGLPPPSDAVDEQLEHAKQMGDALIREHPDRDLSFLLLQADPVDGVVDHLNAGDHDWLAIGSHGRRGVKRLVLGSVAEHVVRRATRSVLVAHGKHTQ
jgi:nucleotide-binding universal stress UspA family protein